MAVTKAGAIRQEMHEVIREHSLAAWAKLNAGEPNPLIETLSNDARITHYLESAAVRSLMNADEYVGDAPARARHLAQLAMQRLGE